MNATVLKFLIWISHEKMADTCFFLFQEDYVPFLSYDPLKKKMYAILSAKHLKTIQARALKLNEQTGIDE